MMQKALIKLVKPLAAIGMLNLAVAAPASAPTAGHQLVAFNTTGPTRMIPPTSPFTPTSTASIAPRLADLPVSLNVTGPTTVTLLMDTILSSPTRNPDPFAPSDFAPTTYTISGSEALETLIQMSPSQTLNTLRTVTPSQLSTTTDGEEAEDLSTMEVSILPGGPITEPTGATAGTTTSALPSDDLSSNPTHPYNIFIAPPDPGLDPFRPNCRTSAMRALYKWRDDCDRSPLAHMQSHCWGRAPSPPRCCDDPSAQSMPPGGPTKVGKDVIKKASPKSCFKYWPKTRAEEFMCCHTEQQSKVGGEAWDWCWDEDGHAGKRPPRSICECVDEKCGTEEYPKKNPTCFMCVDRDPDVDPKAWGPGEGEPGDGRAVEVSGE